MDFQLTWAWMDLNHRHPPYKGGALTTELHALVFQRINKMFYDFAHYNKGA